MGNPKPPTTHEIIKWTVTLGQEYKDFTLPEISKAIKLSLVGKLYIFEKEYKKVDIGNFHFKPFILICEILTGYREYRKEKMKLHNKNVVDKLKKIESEEIGRTNFINFQNDFKKYLKDNFNSYKETKVFDFKDPTLMYFKRIYSSKYFCLSKNEIDKISKNIKNNIDIPKPKDIYNNNLPFTVFSKLSSDKKENIERSKISEQSIKLIFDKWIIKNVNINEVINSINFKYER